MEEKSNKVVGTSPRRKDAKAKVMGKAKYTADIYESGMLVGKILRSEKAYAYIRNIDTSKAEALPGVEAIISYKDVPKIPYALQAHQFSLDHAGQEDHLIFTDKARFVGDEIGAVIAIDDLTAKKALSLIEVEYEELEPSLTIEAALASKGPWIHEGREHNILSDLWGYEDGDVDKAFTESAHVFEGTYDTGYQQHCHLENHVSYAYMDSEDRIVIVSSTQVPHVARRIVGQALGIPWGRIRVIKPYVGGGFGNKADVRLEPIVAAMTMAVGGRPVILDFSREECMIGTANRHAMRIKIKSGVSEDGKLKVLQGEVLSNAGGYASHGHSPTLVAAGKFVNMYETEAVKVENRTIYTNLPIAGAMRGYGTPQGVYALESHVEDIVTALGLDPITFRKDNFIKENFVNPANGMITHSNGVRECMDRGRELIDWDRKKELYKNQAGPKRRGLGMACFSYETGIYPIAKELGGARIVMNQDGSVQLMCGATEIGQGADTVLAQIAAEVLGIPFDMVHMISTQDTDITPFDFGAYASRQTYVTGLAVKRAANEVKEKILRFAADEIVDLPVYMLDLQDANIVNKHNGQVMAPLDKVALASFYQVDRAEPTTSDVINNAPVNAYSYGATFTEVEVNMRTGKIEILEIFNVHDSGKIINRQLAEGQVEGGMAQAIGQALSEELLMHPTTGKTLNNNLLDYKLPTIMDVPDLGVDFIETYEPTGPMGNKGLGEPPTMSPAPAIRNAVLDATGVAFNRIPMNPQRVFERLKQEGLL